MGMRSGGTGEAATLDDRTRDACLHSLGDQYAAGRLTDAELECRIQAVLAAETEAELAAAMADVANPSTDHGGQSGTAYRPDPLTRTAQLLRWGAGGLVLAAGGLLSAVVGPGSNVVEFAVGLAVALLGFLTHWWLSERPVPGGDGPQEHPPEVRPSPPVLRDDDWCAADDHDEHPVPLSEFPAAGRPIRPMGRGNGGIPAQRNGD